MDKGTTYVGMDVHKRTISVWVRFPDGGFDERMVPHETRAVNRLVRKWKREAPGEIRCAYEARPCGYGLQRDLKDRAASLEATVGAPPSSSSSPKPIRRSSRPIASHSIRQRNASA